MLNEKGPALTGSSTCRQAGQSLLELVVSMAVAILVLGSLAFAIITSLRNAQFASRQTQSTKLAQEALEKVRSLRDRGGAEATDIFACEDTCYFKFNENGSFGGAGPTIFEERPPFKRQIQIENYGENNNQKQVTVVVKWDDAAGPHESRLTTILGKEL